MYNQGIGMLDRTTNGLNHAHMESILNEVKTQRQIPNVNYFRRIKDFISNLVNLPVSTQRVSFVKQNYFTEDDCAKAASPCS
jgi:uncharacterized membrane-anchored protein YjiN (DUF445 family)